jgi:hypothetical protein
LSASFETVTSEAQLPHLSLLALLAQTT